MHDPMATPGDITDEFDDDELRRSIETADKDGQWRDTDARFVDPKIEQLKKQLAEVPRTNYTERRFAELDRRMAERAARLARSRPAATPTVFEPAAEAATDQPAPVENWRQAALPPAEPAPLPTPIPPPPTVVAPNGHRLLAWASTLGAAAVVFGTAAGAHAAISGFHAELGLRAAAAMLVAGLAWQAFAAGRFRSAAIGTAAYLVAFVGTMSPDTPDEMFAAFLGTLVVLLGSGAVGMMREDYAANRPGH